MAEQPHTDVPIALELLVHGVGGTTPEQMLDDPRTVCLAGDTTAGIHRRACDTDAEAHPGRYREAPVPEAYCWSNLTSGNAGRALWLLLLPFMIANLAHWMRPPSTRTRLARWYEVAVRLLALSLTVLLVAAVCEVALDIVGWQCAGRAACTHDKSWLGFAAASRGGWWSQPGRRLALAAAAPLALTGVLWWLSHRTWYAYESQRPAVPSRPPAPGAPSLAQPGFWYGRRSVARLRTAHTAVGLLTIAAALLTPALGHDRGRPGAVLPAIGWSLAGVLVVLVAIAIGVTVRAHRVETGLDDTADPRTTRLLLAGSGTLLAAAVLYGGWSRPGWHSAGRLPSAQAFSALTITQGVLVALLAGTAAALHRARPAEFEDTAPALRGQAGPAVALLGCAIGGVLTGGIAERAADLLDRGRTPGQSGSPLAGPPAVLTWESSVIPAVLVLVLLAGAWLALRLRHEERELCPEVDALYPGEVHHRSRTRHIASALARAGLTDRAPLLVAVLCGTAFVLGGGAVAAAWIGGGTPGEEARGAPGPVTALADTAQSLGSWLVGAGVIALVAVGRRAYKDASARRTVGILWDIGTFWPRAAHPFAPPCYAERAVPDLTWRMATWTQATGGRIVLSGHSQGSVLSAAAVWQLDPQVRGRVALLTYGCPLARLYGRWFPAHFAPARLRELHEEMHAWCNLWRRTDPIGGPVGIGGKGVAGVAGDAGIGGPPVDVGPLLDPAAYGRSAAHPLPEPVLGHSDFQADPAFARTRAGLLARLGYPVPAVPAQGRPAGLPDPLV
ncbi:hypothetical protein [Actinacidiphila guanduensis]|uniref:Integral membrane protein n=1 Tax=Actinacidiphila guanduensis TaxID=310781 RepID=A0A1H0I2S7_9ACTN|nr:hypothetical protein [Actinacidiphila guanduensis]SDO25371.1 hypothetical protein SAMN05216259_108300 [Actinacidiphila guanduensis]